MKLAYYQLNIYKADDNYASEHTFATTEIYSLHDNAIGTKHVGGGPRKL